MGKGDKRTRRGKVWHKTYGKYRPKPSKKRKLTLERTKQSAEAAKKSS